MPSRLPIAAALGMFLLELTLYGVFVAAYFFLVLHFLGSWLEHIFKANKTAYAFLSLLLIFGQGVVLEMLTGFLLQTLRRKRR